MASGGHVEQEELIVVGIVGYCDLKFDHELAKQYLQIEFDKLDEERKQKQCQVKIVSGLTTAGVLGIAYNLAKEYDFLTVGVSCTKAMQYETFPVDERHIIGDNFGDESRFFLEMLTRLIRIGGGEQSLRETKLAKEDAFLKTKITAVIEYDLPRSV